MPGGHSISTCRFPVSTLDRELAMPGSDSWIAWINGTEQCVTFCNFVSGSLSHT